MISIIAGLATLVCVLIIMYCINQWYQQASKPKTSKPRATPSHNLDEFTQAMGLKYGQHNLTRNVTQAFTLLQKIIDKQPQNHRALFELADCYAKGIGVTQCLRLAIDYYKKCYLAGGLRDNQEDAFKHYQALIDQMISKLEAQANRNDHESMYALGYFYLHQHLQNESEGNKIAALKWMQKASKHGHLDATIELAICHYNGYGTPRDYIKAKNAFQMTYETGQRDHIAGYYIIALIRCSETERASEILAIEQDKNPVHPKIIRLVEDVKNYNLAFLLMPRKAKTPTGSRVTSPILKTRELATDELNNIKGHQSPIPKTDRFTLTDIENNDGVYNRLFNEPNNLTQTSFHPLSEDDKEEDDDNDDIMAELERLGQSLS